MSAISQKQTFDQGPERGQHARTAIGAGGLPRGIVVDNAAVLYDFPAA